MIAQLANNQSCRPSNPSLFPVCYWTVIALLFAGAVWQRFKLPLDPIADPDTWGYLSPALRKLTGAEFGHTNGRNFVYPGFLSLFSDPISCLFFRGAPPHGHSCLWHRSLLRRDFSRFHQTEFCFRFAFCTDPHHCLVMAEGLVAAKGLVFSRVRR